MHDWTEMLDEGPAHRQFLRPTWYRAWETAYGDDKNWRSQLQFHAIASGTSSRGVLPIARQRVGPFSFASLAGFFMPYRAVPYCGDRVALAQEAATAFEDMRSVVGVRLGFARHSDSFLAALAIELERRGWRILCQRVGEEFTLCNPGSAEIFMAGLNGKRRHHLGYYWRKLCNEGATELRCFNGCDAQEWKNAFRDVRTVEEVAWVAQSGEPRFLGARNERFWDLLATDEWYSERMRVWMIYHCGMPMSFSVTLDTDNTRIVFANSYDPRFAKFSTGNKIYQEMICDAFSRGLTHIHFGLGDPGNKSGWGAQASAMQVNFVAFAPSVTGHIAYLAARAQERLARRKWPHWQLVPEEPLDAARSSRETCLVPLSTDDAVSVPGE